MAAGENCVLNPDNPFQALGASVTLQLTHLQLHYKRQKTKTKKRTPAQHLVHGRLSLYICIFLFNLRLETRGIEIFAFL